jgi:hypothetical protein
MMFLFLFEVVLLPGYLLSLRILHKYGLLTENRFALIIIAYLSIMISTASGLFPTMSAERIIGFVLAILCWFPGYSIAKGIYRRIFLHK